jgi:glucose-1-phosphate thymidylyltransferase
MQGVVPAAGEGTRLRPLTAERPKGLVDVAGKPLLTHVFETLVSLGVTELVVVVGYRADDIREHYDNSFEGTPITYVEQTERRGLGHAVLQAEPVVDGDFVVLNGDNVCRANTGAVVDRHRETDADATLLVESVSRDRASEGGVIDHDDGAVEGLVEKPDDPPSTLIPRGFFTLSTAIFRALHAVQPGHTGEVELTRAIDRLVQAGRRVETVALSGWCVNVNTDADRETVAAKLADDAASTINDLSADSDSQA